MLWLLAKAEGPDPTDSNLTLVLIAMLTAGAVCLLAAIPVVMARKRRTGPTEGIAALMVLWGIISAGSIIYTASAQMRYTKEYTMRIMQNFDPRDQSDEPAKPWILWGCLLAAYGAAILWATTAKASPARGFPVEPNSSTDQTE